VTYPFETGLTYRCGSALEERAQCKSVIQPNNYSERNSVERLTTLLYS